MYITLLIQLEAFRQQNKIAVYPVKQFLKYEIFLFRFMCTKWLQKLKNKMVKA